MSRIVAIVGSYRKDGVVDRAVEAVLEGARAKGAATHTIYLTEQQIEFCANCRMCTQTEGEERGNCARTDGLDAILKEIEAADAVVLGSPVNYYNVTAIFRRFMERLLGYFYWPWGKNLLVQRDKRQRRKAVLVASAGMPGFLIPLATGASRALRLTAKCLGARTVGSLWIGQVANEPHPPLSARTLKQARLLGEKLA
jgi:multimeric flavodoxin WrbA